MRNFSSQDKYVNNLHGKIGAMMNFLFVRDFRLNLTWADKSG
jgi:hypothetical protein